MGRLTLILLTLCLVVSSCGTTDQTFSPVPQAPMLTRATSDVCINGGSSWPGEWRKRIGGKITLYGVGFNPITCGDPYSPRTVENDYYYKIYFVLADGRRLLFGVDHHPLTAPLSDGPGYGGYPFSNGEFQTWTFVADGALPRVPTEMWPSGKAVIVVELWSHGGKIAENTGFADI